MKRAPAKRSTRTYGAQMEHAGLVLFASTASDARRIARALAAYESPQARAERAVVKAAVKLASIFGTGETSSILKIHTDALWRACDRLLAARKKERAR